MAGARAVLALALVASAWQTGRAEPCVPRAELAGDAEAVALVAVELKRLGVDVRIDGTAGRLRPARCSVIAAAVELDRAGIAVAVRDASQRSEGRVVSDAALAAAWIDSWLRDDFVAPAVETEPVLAPPTSAPVLPVAAAGATTPVLERLSIAASFVQAWGADSTSWSGVAGSACMNTGDVCIGGRVAYASQQVVTDLTGAAKRDVSLLATASYPSAVGRMSIAPELGVGVGQRTISRIEGCNVGDPPMCDPMIDPMCAQKDPNTCASGDAANAGLVYVGDGFSATTYTPRISAALRIAIPLFDHVWLDGLAAATAAPFSHTADYATKAASDNDPSAGGFPLPGDPMFGVELGLGIRVGAR